jgi:nitroimidazol reductase NimA-like FMN-containing flavoprotein (pyridoxamine 5'-phosphate oxidase superfamily)
MAAYGVPDDPDGVLAWSWAEERLLACRNYWVVTADASGRPHALPVWGIWVPEAQVYRFSCAPTARKARNIAANPQVCVAVDSTVECVSVEGRASLLADQAVIAETARIYCEKYWPPDEREEMAAFLIGHAVFEVVPQRAFGIIETEEDFARRATRWVW